MAGTARYAIYFAPGPTSALARFGKHWLGRDPSTGAEEAQPTIPGITPERLQEITADARHYGFHATLKPPFILAEGYDARTLHQAIQSFVAGRPALQAPPLKLAALSGFLALIPSLPASELGELAADCVREFDQFRAPADAAELAKRRQHGLTARQDELLQQWGYPYVMEEFRFHMTVTARLEAAERITLINALQPMLAGICRRPLRIDAVALFEQPNRNAPFRLVRRYALAGSSARLSA